MTISTCTSTRSPPRNRSSASASPTAISCCRQRPGCSSPRVQARVLANYGLDTLRFINPVGIGDTIQARLTCKRKIDRARPARWASPGRGGVGCGGDQPAGRAGRQLRHSHPRAEEALTVPLVRGGGHQPTALAIAALIQWGWSMASPLTPVLGPPDRGPFSSRRGLRDERVYCDGWRQRTG